MLFRVLSQHLATFLHDAGRAHDGAGLPRFVEKELQAFLKCGVLAHGFARFRCSDCKFERLVPQSCKGRGFCPSCGGKRMTDIAAHLTDHVVPLVLVRQFALSLPHALRYRLAYDHDRCIAVLRIFLRAVIGFYRRRAHARGVPGCRSGSVTFVQRFGSAANLNLHAHAIVLDGVFTQAPNGELRFHRAEPPRDADIAALLATIRKRILRHLQRHEMLEDDRADPLSDEAPLLASCYATSIGHRQTMGKRPGARLHRIGDPDAVRAEHRAPLQATLGRARTQPPHARDDRSRRPRRLRRLLGARGVPGCMPERHRAGRYHENAEGVPARCDHLRPTRPGIRSRWLSGAYSWR